jgi:hypothetical protein
MNALRAALLAALALPLAAQDAPADRSLHFGAGLMTASGLGDLSHDVNGHLGYGFRLQAYVPLSGRFEVRPAFEWTGYRVSGANQAAIVVANALGVDYQDSRTVFRTYRLGVDGLFYFRDRREGPFLSLGLGAQRSEVELEDVGTDPNGQSTTTLDARARKTGLWLGAGLGYQWRQANLELRLSEAPYAYTSERALTAQPVDAPFGGRQGYALHLIFGFKL